MRSVFCGKESLLLVVITFPYTKKSRGKQRKEETEETEEKR